MTKKTQQIFVELTSTLLENVRTFWLNSNFCDQKHTKILKFHRDRWLESSTYIERTLKLFPFYVATSSRKREREK